MEKVKLKNDTVLEIVPNGIISNDKTRCIKLISSLTYQQIEDLFEDESSINEIQYLSESGETLATFFDCVSLKSLSKEKGVALTDTLTADVYTVELSIDAVENKLIKVQEYTDNAVCELTMLLSMLYV